MTDADATWFVKEYDKAVAEAGADGLAREKARDAVAHRYLDAVETGEVGRYNPDLVAEARDLFDKFTGKIRQTRKTTMRGSMENLLAVIQGDALLEESDPILEWSFPLGDDQGNDKTLRYWTVDDWTSAAANRFSRAAQASTAADEFYQRSKEIIAAMKRGNARWTGDLIS